MLVTVDGKADGRAHVYDSKDFQRMLLVLEAQKAVAVLDLPGTMVYTMPYDSVSTSDEGNAYFDETSESYLGGLQREKGVVTFEMGGKAIAIQPIPPLIGPTTLTHLLELKPSYAIAAQAYKPDPAKIAILKAVAPDTEIKVYFGTWCLMCKKLVPPLIRTIGMAGNPKIQIQYIGVDEDMTQPSPDLQNDHVSKTPTVLVLQGGREIGRIEEKAETTIEGDLANILSQK